MSEKRLSPYQVLRYKFPESEYVLLCEVSDATGASRSRSLDYMLVNLWESRGLAITGIEQKSSRTDWLRELKNPKKQENHFRYCDYFYLLTDNENVAKIEEIPDTWGWYHINKSQILKTMKPAPKLNATPVGRSFLCAMLRRAADKANFVHRETLDDYIEEVAAKIADRQHSVFKHGSEQYKELKERVELFEKASGLNISRTWDRTDKLGEAVRVIMNGGAAHHEKKLGQLFEQAEIIRNEIEKSIKAFQSSV